MRPVDTLRRHMELGSTGTLTVQPTEGQPIAVYLMQGEILAAETPVDGLDIVTRLENGGAVGVEQGRALRERLLRSDQVGDVLFGAVSDDLLMDLYTRRFRENLASFIRSIGMVSFAERETIHVENVQVGHDSYELLEELEEQLVLIGPVLRTDGAVRLQQGEEAPQTTRQARVVGCLPPGGTLSELIAASPYELHETLAHVAALLDAGCLIADEPGPGARPNHEESAADDLDEEILATEEIDTGEEPDDPYAMFLGESDAVISHDDGPVVLDQPGDHDELSMFRDHDRRRRANDGSFTVSRELLDKVDLSGFSFLGEASQSDDQILEMEDGDRLDASSGAVNLCFMSPPLGSEDAARKIDVTNEVLRQICQALDEEHGSGSGQATVQLLVESCPMEVASLFHGAEPGRDGSIDCGRVVRNLEQRPEAERRRLLNGALRDLVERGFSATAERISESRLEVMLERIAGFQQRLGL